MKLVGEAALLSDLCDGVAGVEQKICGSFKPFRIELFCGRRLAGDTTKLEQMLAGGAGCAGDLLERDWLRVGLGKESFHTPQHPFPSRYGARVVEHGGCERADDRNRESDVGAFMNQTRASA